MTPNRIIKEHECQETETDWIDDELPWKRTLQNRQETGQRVGLHWTKSGLAWWSSPGHRRWWGRGTGAEWEKHGGWHKEEDGRVSQVFFRFSFSLFFILAGGGTHRLPARKQSWLACFVQKRQRPRQCRMRPYRNPHSLKPGPHPHSLQQSDTQPQPTALNTPGRGIRPSSSSIYKPFVAFFWNKCATWTGFYQIVTIQIVSRLLTKTLCRRSNTLL